MYRASLLGLPQHDTDAPYTIRRYRDGDEEAWRRIQEVSDAYNTFTAETFEREFGSDRDAWAERQYYVCDSDGEAVGTATAWRTSDRDGECGLVHWIAIHPQHQGRGLSRPLLGTVCNRLAELGHTRARLTTSTGRLPALRLYLSFGFVPVVEKEGDRKAWVEVREALRTQGRTYEVLESL